MRRAASLFALRKIGLSRKEYSTPAEYIISQRMKRARTLLPDRKLLIKEVARRAGYADPLYFSAEFRRLHGVSPRGFRRRHTS